MRTKSGDGSLLNSETTFPSEVDIELPRILALPRETRTFRKRCVVRFMGGGNRYRGFVQAAFYMPKRRRAWSKPHVNGLR